MKNLIFVLITLVFVLLSCNQKYKENEPSNDAMIAHDSAIIMTDSSMINKDLQRMDNLEVLYACPMHPEEQGNLNDKCLKCGMELTGEVK